MNFDKIHVSLKYYALGKGYVRFLKALTFAKTVHTGKRKDNVTNEIQHQYEIALFITSLNLPSDQEESAMCAALLHDVKEDYNISDSHILYLFGSNPEDLIFGQKQVQYMNRLSKFVNGRKKSNNEYFSEMENCFISAIVKGSDRYHNQKSMPGVFSKEKMIEYIKETEDHIIPMIKKSKDLYPEYSSAFFNVKTMLETQVSIFKFFLIQEKEK